MLGRVQLLGRDSEVARLRGRLDALRAGRGSVLAIVGDPGIGKTALLEWLACEAHDLRVLRVTGVESEVELAFSGLAELCLPLVDGIDELPRPQQEALRAALALDGGRPG